MRLLKIEADGSLTMVNHTSRNIPPYAILSHTWMGDDDEVSYEDWVAGIAESKAGYAKIRLCANQASRDSLEYIWADTCCIQKSSSAELSEAINSMYAWYQDAAVCYAFLADVPSERNFSSCKWFTRGWTMQELIAPASLVFYDETWACLGSKEDLRHTVSECTGIPANVLSGEESVDAFSIAQKMSWAARRVTTRVEDMAYCMLGLFDINMPLIYGEGENAFMRLQEEILRISEDQSIFAWRSLDDRGGCLATSPAAFSHSGTIAQSNPLVVNNGPTIVSSSGVHLDLPFVATCQDRRGYAILNCVDREEGDKHIAIRVRDMTLMMNRFERVSSDKLVHVNLGMPSLVRRLCIQKGRIRRNAQYDVARKDASLDLPLFGPSSSSLFDAAANGLDDEVWFYLCQKDTDVNSVDSKGMSALDHAARNGTETTMRMLLGHPGIQLDHKALDLTPFHLAAEGCNVAVMRLLLDAGTRDVNRRSKHGWTPFAIAARNGHESIIKLLLQERGRIRVDAKGVDDRTPLSWAADYGHEAVVRALLDTNSVDVESKSNVGWPPMIYAARSGQSKTISLLSDVGKAQLDMADPTGRTPLSHAMENGHEGVVMYLLATKKVDVNSMDSLGRTPLMWAVQRKQVRVIQTLLSTAEVDKIPKSAQRFLRS